LNPVRANLVKSPGEYRWSSARAHLSGKNDKLVTVLPLLNLVSDWVDFLSNDVPNEEREELSLYERTGRPLGSELFISHIETLTGRVLRRQKPGPKKNLKN
jgi:putative transposase